MPKDLRRGTGRFTAFGWYLAFTLPRQLKNWPLICLLVYLLLYLLRYN